MKKSNRFLSLLMILVCCISLLIPCTTNAAAPKINLGKYKKGSGYLVLAYNVRQNSAAYIRSTPSTGASILATLSFSDAIVVNQDAITAGVKTCWIPVTMANTKATGYILTNQVKLKAINMNSFKNSTNKNAKKAIQYGLKYLGTPYKGGGNSITKGICCSALVTKCLRKAGYTNLPNTMVQEQYNKAYKFLRKSQLKPGDLIFYRANTHAPYGGLVHVGIYIGNGFTLNATGHTGTTYPNGGICIKTMSYGTHLATRAIYGRLSYS